MKSNVVTGSSLSMQPCFSSSTKNLCNNEKDTITERTPITDGMMYLYIMVMMYLCCHNFFLKIINKKNCTTVNIKE